jgi:hypothetical protein
MKTYANLLNNVIRRYLTEQFENETQPEEDESDLLHTRKTIIMPMSAKERANVIANGGITGFTSIKKLRKAPVAFADYEIAGELKNNIAADGTWGEGHRFDKTDKSGNARYMYVIGDDVSKQNRKIKTNVWVLLYSPLLTLAQEIDKRELSSTYYNVIISSPVYTIGNIPVYTYDAANKWIQSLKAKSSALNLKLIDTGFSNKEIQWPNLASINKPESDTGIESEKTVTVDSVENEYMYGFVGTLKFTYDAYGNSIAIPIDGTIGLVRANAPDVKGKFTGKFINGLPADGTLTYDDGYTYTGKIKGATRYEEDGEIHFSVPDQSNSVITPPVEKETIVEPEKNTEEKQTYPQKSSDGTMIYTLSDADTRVYYYDTTQNAWYHCLKSDYEEGGTLTFKLLSETKTAAELFKISGITPNNNKKKITPPDPNEDDKKVETNEYKKGDLVSFTTKSRIMLFWYKNGKFIDSGRVFTPSSAYRPKFMQYSSDKKYALLDFSSYPESVLKTMPWLRSEKYWVVANLLKAK